MCKFVHFVQLADLADLADLASWQLAPSKKNFFFFILSHQCDVQGSSTAKNQGIQFSEMGILVFWCAQPGRSAGLEALAPPA